MKSYEMLVSDPFTRNPGIGSGGGNA